MFEVLKVNKSQDTKTSKAKNSSSGANFSDFLNKTSASNTPTISATSNISIPNAIFAAQTISSEEEEKRKQKIIKRGFSLIEKLEEIRTSILLNDFSKEKLIEISRYVKNVSETSADEQLNSIIAEIELRVEVELAKLENLITQM